MPNDNSRDKSGDISTSYGGLPVPHVRLTRGLCTLCTGYPNQQSGRHGACPMPTTYIGIIVRAYECGNKRGERRTFVGALPRGMNWAKPKKPRACPASEPPTSEYA